MYELSWNVVVSVVDRNWRFRFLERLLRLWIDWLAGLIEVSRLLLLGVRIDWVTACWIDRVLFAILWIDWSSSLRIESVRNCLLVSGSIWLSSLWIILSWVLLFQSPD